MRLLRCSVQNFGTLSDFKIEFNSGLTVINEANGFGKTTLAAFLKAMFYGLPQTTKRSITENERKRYTPWQNGVFGGTLEFEAKGKNYRLERSFAAKERDDVFKLFSLDTGAESDDYTENIGVELFGVDADSFERSVFVPQQALATGITSDVRTRLTGLMESSDDINNFDRAVKMLEGRAKEYSIAKGARGAIADKQREIDLCRQRLADGEVALQNLKAITEQLILLQNGKAKKSGELEQLRKKITLASDIAARKAEQQQRAEVSSQLKTVSAELAELNRKYPKGFPTDEALTDANETLKLKESAKTELSLLVGAFTANAELDSLHKMFDSETPTEQELDQCRQDILCLRDAENKLREFDGLKPEATDKNQSGVLVRLMVIAAVGLALGGAVLAFFELWLGLGMLFGGLLCVGASAFFYLKSMISANGRNAGYSREDYERALRERDQLTEKISAYLGRFLPESEPERAIEQLSRAVADYSRLKQEYLKNQTEIGARKQRIAECGEALELFFKNIGVVAEVGDAEALLSAVLRERDEHHRLQKREKELQIKLSQLPDSVELEDTELLDREALLLEEKQLILEINKLSEQITGYGNEAEKLSAVAEQKIEAEELLDTLLSEHSDMVQSLNVLNLTSSFLLEAKTDLSKKYLSPMTESFKRYSRVLGLGDGDLLIDTDLTLKLEKNGSLREKAAFSAGVQDMLDIAMRLSLADALFGDENAMLILDDPFVNLDDIHLNESLKLLKRLAETRQIIYLTCHSSRC